MFNSGSSNFECEKHTRITKTLNQGVMELNLLTKNQ